MNIKDMERAYANGVQAGQKVDWRKVWGEFQAWWNEETVGPTDWPRQKKVIQRLVKKHSGKRSKA